MKRSIISWNVLPAMAAAIVAVISGCISVEEIQKKADAGDKAMQYDMAIRHKEGNGVPLDAAKAEEYLQKSFESGYIPAACEIANEIHDKGNIDASKKLMKCYNIIFGTSPKDLTSAFAQDKFSRNFPASSRSYLRRLVKAEKTHEALEYSKCVLMYLDYKHCPTARNVDAYRRPFMQYLAEAEKRIAKQKAEEKRLAEQKAEEQRLAGLKSKFQQLEQDQQLKYPNRTLGKGIKLYKNVCAGSSLEWLEAYAAVSNKKIKCVPRPMFEDEFLPGIPETWRGQTFRQNYAEDNTAAVSFIFAGAGKEQAMIGCCIILQNVQVKSIIEKYQKEFPGLKPQEKRAPQLRFIAMVGEDVRIQIVVMQPGNFVSIFIADQKYVDWYRKRIQKTEEGSSQKALDF